MCGFAGYLGGSSWHGTDTAGALLRRMNGAIETRGPDDAGYWHDGGGVALGHRRLAILDLTPAGHQPMVSACGRYVIAYNGEIYNHLELRAELEEVGQSPGWRGHSDTETLLAACSAWGIRGAVERAVGMFALALWDRAEQVLTLGRDRLGEKPLYYGWQGRGAEACFLFGSDLAALKAHPAFAAGIDRGALCLLMRHNYIPAPHSIYEGVLKVPPGYLLTVSRNRPEPRVQAYWSLPEVAAAGVAAPFAGTDAQAIDELEAVLQRAVGRQMVADVPLGAFLSGGIDSSVVVALMQAQSSRPVRTFTIGFEETDYDEAGHARAVAAHLGTDHTELYVTAREALDVIPRLPALYSEPFSDSSQIPTFLVSQLARRHVTVSLSGDGGDELFCGYPRYELAGNIWGQLKRWPPGVRAAAATALRTLPAAGWNAVAAPIRGILPASRRGALIGDKLHKGAALLRARRIDDLYLGLVSHWDPSGVVRGAQEPLTPLRGAPPALAGLDERQRLMALDALTYLPDDILVKVDRAAMGVSLETRVPLLDHRVVAFAWRLPQHLKRRHGVGKWALRQVLHRHVPEALVERPKMGFGIPLASWLRGPLRDWAEALLDEARLKRDGFFHPGPIRQKWAEHLSGTRNWQSHLWDVLMFQAWLDHHGG